LLTNSWQSVCFFLFLLESFPFLPLEQNLHLANNTHLNLGIAWHFRSFLVYPAAWSVFFFTNYLLA
jgi:hypothetical protein